MTLYIELVPKINLAYCTISDTEIWILTTCSNYHWSDACFWKSKLILENYTDPIIIPSLTKIQLKKISFVLYNFFWWWIQMWNQFLSVDLFFKLFHSEVFIYFLLSKIVLGFRGARDTITCLSRFMDERDTNYNPNYKESGGKSLLPIGAIRGL